jgi:hypothetical protein
MPRQQVDEHISIGELRNIVYDQIGPDAAAHLQWTDTRYKLVDLDHLQVWLCVNPVNRRAYVPIVHDCDDFADILLGDINRWDSDLAVGSCWFRRPYGLHALNWCVCTNRQVWLIEPQTDRIFKIPDNWQWCTHLYM